MLRKAKVLALDQLLLERFGGVVGRGLAVGIVERTTISRRPESLFALPSPTSVTTVRIVKFHRNRENMQGSTCVCSRRTW